VSVGRHRAPRRLPRRAAVPAAVGAVLLAAAVATSVTADPAPVTGTPSAATTVEQERRVQRTLAGATPTPWTPPPPPPATSTAPPAPPPPPATPAAPAPQAPNTVRLAGGGTATLVRKEVVDGVLPIPDGIREATWWGAAFDAAGGATVLAGHVNWRGATGPFAELWKAKLGDRVTVVDGNGAVHEYQVRQLVTVHKNDLPHRAQELFGQDGAHRLVLVTCGGRWVGGRDGYEENRIVIAD
jgi:LPXTG-site transpeptidase (sortase) family protein